MFRGGSCSIAIPKALQIYLTFTELVHEIFFRRSSKSKCLNIEAEAGERTVVYEEIGTNATREIRSRVARGIMVNIDLSNFYEDKFVLKLPGEVMNGDDQCVLQYGLGFRQCSQFAVRT